MKDAGRLRIAPIYYPKLSNLLSLFMYIVMVILVVLEHSILIFVSIFRSFIIKEIIRKKM